MIIVSTITEFSFTVTSRLRDFEVSTRFNYRQTQIDFPFSWEKISNDCMPCKVKLFIEQQQKMRKFSIFFCYHTHARKWTLIFDWKQQFVLTISIEFNRNRLTKEWNKVVIWWFLYSHINTSHKFRFCHWNYCGHWKFDTKKGLQTRNSIIWFFLLYFFLARSITVFVIDHLCCCCGG